ncbi:MAG: ATP-binding cassette domain-containing protein [Oscillospiraceae bacterium]|nr:ATP-binding cassette domain-containing protein [Oscillospiraceae bacterium]
MEYAISARGLAKSFRGREVIRDCTLEIKRGEVYGFLGENGAGKTTVFKMLLGLLKPSAGEAAVLGLDCVRQSPEILRRTGSLIETPVFYEHLSARENLEIHLAYLEAIGDPEEALELVGLQETGEQPVAEFSLGMRQRLAVARAIVHRPEVLILDEPVNGLDPAGIHRMRELFLHLNREEGITILLSSHILHEVEQTASRIGILTHGRVAAEVDPQEIGKDFPGGMEAYYLQVVGEGGTGHE